MWVHLVWCTEEAHLSTDYKGTKCVCMCTWVFARCWDKQRWQEVLCCHMTSLTKGTEQYCSRACPQHRPELLNIVGKWPQWYPSRWSVYQLTPHMCQHQLWHKVNSGQKRGLLTNTSILVHRGVHVCIRLAICKCIHTHPYAPLCCMQSG